jgi:transcriptional regulator with XRE-family HTH domain
MIKMGDSKEIGARIRAAREGAHITQQTLANALGLSVGSVSRIERGSFEPSLRTAAAILKALDMDFDDLFAEVRKNIPRRGLKGRIYYEVEKLPAPEQRVILDLIRSMAAHRPHK